MTWYTQQSLTTEARAVAREPGHTCSLADCGRKGRYVRWELHLERQHAALLVVLRCPHDKDHPVQPVTVAI